MAGQLIGTPTTGSGSNPASGTWTLPSGYQEGDLAVVWLFARVTGWAAGSPGFTTSGVTQKAYINTSHTMYVGYKWLASGSETSPTFTRGTSTANCTVVWGCFVIRNACDSSNLWSGDPFDAESGPTIYSATEDPNPGAVTPGRIGDTVITIFGRDDEATLTSVPSGYTGCGFVSESAGTDGAGGAAYKVVTSTSSEDPGTWNLNTNTNLNGYTYTASIRNGPRGAAAQAFTLGVTTSGSAEWLSSPRTALVPQESWDAYVLSVDSAYPPVAANANVQDSADTTTRGLNGGIYTIGVCVMYFDTSGIPDDATVTSATLRIYPSTRIDNDNRSLSGEWYAGTPPVVAGDWAETASSTAFAPVDLGSVGLGSYQEFALTDPASYVSKGGATGLRLHITGTTPTSDNSLDWQRSVNANPPQLVVTFGTPDTHYGATTQAFTLGIVTTNEKLTGVARISLAGGSTPATRTGHAISVRARVTSGAGKIKAALYEGATRRSGILTSDALTTSFASYSLAIADADAATISSYADLELRIWGASSTGVTFEVAEASLSIPAASGAQTGTVVTPITLGVTTSGKVGVRGQSSVPLTAGITTSGKVTSQGQVVTPLTLGITTSGAGTNVKYGQVVSPFTASVVTASRVGVKAQVVTPITLGIVTNTGTSTGVARLSLQAGSQPLTRTNHSLRLRARVTSGAGTINAALYEGATNRSGNLQSSALTTSFADYTLAISDANAATIGSYGNLEVRVWGFASEGGAIVFEVAEVELLTPEAATGAISLPITLGVTTSGSTVATKYGEVVTPLTLGITSNGIRIRLGQSIAALTFQVVTTAKAGLKGQVVTPFTFGVVTSGRRVRLGQVIAPFTFGVVAAARVGVKAQSVVGFTLGVVTNGIRVRLAQSVVSLTLGVVTTGRLGKLGQVVVSEALGIVTSGKVGVKGQVVTPLTLTTTTAGVRVRLGQSIVPFTAGITTAAKLVAKAQSSVPLALGVVTSGKPTVRAQVVTQVSLVVTAAGRLSAKAQSALALTLGIVTSAGVSTKLGQVTTALTLDVVGSAKAVRFGSNAVPLTLAISTAGRLSARAASVVSLALGVVTAGRLGAVGQVVAPETLAFLTSGKLEVKGQSSFGGNFNVVTDGTVISTARRALVSWLALEVPKATAAHYGTVISPFTLGVTTTGKVDAKAQVVTPLTWLATTTGKPTVRAASVLALALDRITVGTQTAKGQVSLPLALERATSGVVGYVAQVVTPLTLAISSAAKLEAKAASATVLTFSAVTSGVRTAFGQVVTPLTLSIYTQAGSGKFGQVVTSLTLDRVTSAVVGAKGQVVTPITLGVTTTGVRGVVAQSVTTLTLGITSAARVVAKGQVVTPITLGFTSAARLVAKGVSSLPITLGITTSAGGATKLGQVVLPITASVVSAGKAGVKATSTVVETLGIVTQGTRALVAQAIAPFTLGITTSGKRTALAQVTLGETLEISTAGERTVLGSCSFGATIGIVTDGTALTNARRALVSWLAFEIPKPVSVTHYGTAAVGLSLNVTSSAKVSAKSAIVAPFTLQINTAATRVLRAQVVTPLTLSFFSAAKLGAKGSVVLPIAVGVTSKGAPTRFAQVSLPITLGITTQGAQAGNVYGAVVMPLALAIAAAGTRTTFSQSSTAISFVVESSGTRTTYGFVAAPHIFGIVTVGTRFTYGVVVLGETLLIVTAGQIPLGYLLRPAHGRASVRVGVHGAISGVDSLADGNTTIRRGEGGITTQPKAGGGVRRV